MKKILAVFLTEILAFCCFPAPALAVGVSAHSSDPVEEAGATVYRHLEALRAEQEESMRRRTVELARTTRPIFVSAVSPALGQGSLDWIAAQSNPRVTGFQPIPGREGLLVSYSIPPSDPLAFLRGRSWTYDNAVGAIGFLQQGRADRAKAVLLALQGLISPTGTLGFSYQVDSSTWDSRVRTGTLAWVGYAMALYQRQTGDNRFQASAERIGTYLKTLQASSGSLRGGPDVLWISTEHNIDAYFLYRELFRVTGNSSYRTTADQIKSSLLRNHWVRTRTGGRFLQGIGDSAAALDANSLGAIFLWAIGDGTRAGQALRYVETTFKNTQKIAGSSTRVTGYAPDSARRTVWLEGTLGVAMAYQRLGRTATADGILRSLYRVQSVWQAQGKWRGALPYAMPRTKNADGDTYSDLESVASTGWLLMTLSVRRGNAAFWDRD